MLCSLNVPFSLHRSGQQQAQPLNFFLFLSLLLLPLPIYYHQCVVVAAAGMTSGSQWCLAASLSLSSLVLLECQQSSQHCTIFFFCCHYHYYCWCCLSNPENTFQRLMYQWRLTSVAPRRCTQFSHLLLCQPTYLGQQTKLNVTPYLL